MDPQVLERIGSLAIVAGVVLWLTRWLTQSLNGKLDRLGTSVDKCTDAVQENTAETKRFRDELRRDRTAR